MPCCPTFPAGPALRLHSSAETGVVALDKSFELTARCRKCVDFHFQYVIFNCKVQIPNRTRALVMSSRDCLIDMPGNNCHQSIVFMDVCFRMFVEIEQAS